MIAWRADAAPEGAPREGRSRVDTASWQRLPVGAPTQIVRLGRETFHANSVYVEPGNFAFDFVLLATELAAVGVGVYGLVRMGRGEDAPRKKSRPSRWS